MPTINPTRIGYIVGTGGSSFATSRTANGSIAADGAAGNYATAIQSFYNSGRGGGTHRQTRTYLHFDTSGIFGTVSSVTLGVTGYSQTTSDVIVLNGYNAFGGDGGTALNVDDFNEVGMGGTSQAYSPQFTPWTTSTNSITLNSNAENRMSSNDDLTIGLINYTHDYSNSAQTTSGAQSAGIAFSTTIQLTYSAATGGPNLKLNSVDSTNISRWDSTSWSSISKINGIS